jgi:Tfp pilus assembly protein PilN
MPSSDINLVPQEVQSEKRHSNRRRFLTVFSIAQLVVVVAVTVAIVLFIVSQKRAISSAQAQIDRETKLLSSQLSTIQLVKDIEIRSEALRDVLVKRIYYSRVLSAFPSFLPTGMSISQLTVNPTNIRLTAKARSVVDIAKFLKVIIDPEQGGKFFSQVNLRSVNLDSGTGEANFLINLDIHEGLLGVLE